MTLLGITILVKEGQSAKTKLPIKVRPLPISTLANLEQLEYLQPVITQYFVRNKSEICHRPLRVHSKG